MEPSAYNSNCTYVNKVTFFESRTAMKDEFEKGVEGCHHAEIVNSCL